jgi:excisionase family DNA binding protein
MSDRTELRKATLRPDEVASALRVSRATVYRWIEEGTVPVVMDRKPYRIQGAWLRAVINKEGE